MTVPMLIIVIIVLLAAPSSWGQIVGPNDTYENNPVLRELYENREGGPKDKQFWKAYREKWDRTALLWSLERQHREYLKQRARMEREDRENQETRRRLEGLGVFPHEDR